MAPLNAQADTPHGRARESTMMRRFTIVFSASGIIKPEIIVLPDAAPAVALDGSNQSASRGDRGDDYPTSQTAAALLMIASDRKTSDW